MNTDLPNDLLAAGFRLDGKTAVVSGAGSVGPGFGIGRATAMLLAEAGAHVAVVDRDLDSAQQTVALIEARGGIAAAFELDAVDDTAAIDAFRLIEEMWGPVGVLVNNVGLVGPPGTVEDVDLERWDNAMRINVASVVVMSRHAVPSLRRAGGGSIINMSSIAAVSAGYPAALYPTTKGAILSLTRAMAGHHGSDGIRVNAVLPGALFTPRIEVRKPSERQRIERAEGNLLHTEGDAWDAAYAVLYLAGDAARWVTGTSIVVDAGATVMGPPSSPPST